MRIRILSLGAAAVLGLAGCSDIMASSGPPVAGTAAGPGAAPLQQQTRETMGANSPNASGGTARITGGTGGGEQGGGRPVIERTGATGPGAGSATPVPLPTGGARQQGGGG